MQGKLHAELYSRASTTYGDASTIKNILVAIRDPGVATIIADMLRESGHVPLVVAHVADAVEALTTHRIDLVIVEGTSSDRTALHLRNVLRAAWPDLPAVVLVDEDAVISRGTPDDVVALGFVAARPIRGLILLAAIRRALASSAETQLAG